MKKITSPARNTVHELKTWPEYFQAVKYGFKNFEIRENDRDYKMGDILELREWEPKTGQYSGDKLIKRVNYIMHGPGFGLKKGFGVMGITNDPYALVNQIEVKKID